MNKALQLKSSPIEIVKPKCGIISSKVSRTYINPGDTSIETMSRKGKEHDNDEGFEESQSMMSESPSQGN